MANIADQIKVKQDTDGMLHRALERIIQLYTDKSHFVYELLQNAEDSEATQIKFVQHDRYLEVMHNGKPFTETNLAGLCDIGKSDKADNLNQIGEFGVGFKSVYGICDTVRLFSNPDNYHGKEPVDATKFAVQINGFITPVDIEQEEMPKEYTTRFVFLYSAGRDYSGFTSVSKLNATLTRKLTDLGITTLLFMKNLELIEYEIQTEETQAHGQYSLDKNILNGHCMLVSASGSSSEEKEEEKLHFLKYSRPINDGSTRTVDIAFPVRKNPKEKGYIFEKSSNPYVSVYFPTETESKLDFIVQGPFRTTPNRTSIPADDKDNIRFAEETAKLLKECLIELRDNGIFNMSLLRILPLDPTRFDNFPLFLPLYSAVRSILRTEKILPCRNGKYTSREFAKIARQEKLPEIFPDDVLTELIGDGKKYHWLPSVLTETSREYGHVWRFLVGPEMRVGMIRTDDLKSLFSSNSEFLPTRSDDWLVELYSFLENITYVFSKTKNESNLLTCDFIKTSKGTFEAPYRKIEKQYIPNIFLPSKKVSSEGIIFVDENIYNRCQHFFRDVLALTLPDEYEFFVINFKKRYSREEIFDKEKHIKDISYLLKYIKYDDHTDEVKLLIRDYLYLQCDDGIARRPGSCKIFMSETDSGLKIQQYYKNISKERFFIDQEFYESHGITESHLVQLGVKNSLIISNDVVEGVYDNGAKGYSPSWFTRGEFRWKLSIDLIKEALLYINEHQDNIDSFFKSQAILIETLNNDTKLQGNVFIGGNTPNLYGETCELINILNGKDFKEWDGRWIFTESKELVSPKKISKYDLSTQIYGTIKTDSDIFEMLGFKKTTADEIEQITKGITQKQRDAFFESEFKKRYGITPADFESGTNYNSISQIVDEEEILPFPTANLKNWDSLKKHAVEMLTYAKPAEYAKVLRSIRVSNKDTDRKAYLRGMYKYTGTNKIACQMCHEPTTNPVCAELFKQPDLELDPVNLFLCPNCAAEYNKLRNDEVLMRQFKKSIVDLREDAITDNDIVIIPLDTKEIWFTQIHFAEIQLLFKYKSKAKDAKNCKAKGPETNSENEQESQDDIDYSIYFGKKIICDIKDMEGIIRGYDEDDKNYIVIDVKEGPRAGQTITMQADNLLDVTGTYKIE